mgnify:FL=1
MGLIKSFLFILLNTAYIVSLSAQNVSIYHPEADAQKELSVALTKAQNEGKHVFVQIGGNWCSWCLAFEKKINETEELKTILNNNYIVFHLNYSKENRNELLLKTLGYPQRFGFPVFVILDAQGHRLHTQNSSYLEEGKGHSTQKVKEFLLHWTWLALNPQ